MILAGIVFTARTPDSAARDVRYGRERITATAPDGCPPAADLEADLRMTSEPAIPTLHLSQDPEADALLARSPFALLVGLVLDQQIPTERALAAPATIALRIGRDLVPAEIAEYDPEQFAAVLSEEPAVHRSPIAMAGKIQKLAAHITTSYGGDVTRMWSDDSTAAEVVERFEQLPGFGKPKARILLALLGKQLGVTPNGWREVAGPYGAEGIHLSLADVVDQASLKAVRAAKRERKQAKRIVAGGAGGPGRAGSSAETGGRIQARRTSKAANSPTALSPHVVQGSGVSGVRAPR